MCAARKPPLGGNMEFFDFFTPEDLKLIAIVLAVLWGLCIWGIYACLCSYSYYLSDEGDLVVDVRRGRPYDMMSRKKLFVMYLVAPITLFIIALIIVNEH
jgi:hypothetical protein